MASTRITLVRNSSKTFEIDIVDDDGVPLPLADLAGASADVYVRTAATSNVDVLHFSTADAAHLAFKETEAVLTLVFAADDTAAIDLGAYVYRVVLTLADGRTPDIIPWSPFDLVLGGVAAVTPPVFDNTAVVDHDFDLPGNLRYMSPGGTPIENAQVRVYRKTDYDARLFNAPVGITETDAYGKWKQPVLVAPGYTYVVQFLKQNEYGPDVTTIVV